MSNTDTTDVLACTACEEVISVCLGCATEATLRDGFFEGDDVVCHMKMMSNRVMMYKDMVIFSSRVSIGCVGLLMH